MYIKYVDLCCGIGGFRIALNNVPSLKARCVLSVDNKQDAIDTYNINFKEDNVVTDIYTLKNEKIEPFDLLCAGFPCQPFSSAGHKKGFSDTRGGMIFKIIDICDYHKPKFVVLENVPNLLTIENGECIKRIINLFENLGYHVSYRKLNSCDFGCPQSRERVYIVCTRENRFDLENTTFKPKLYLKNIIDHSFHSSSIDDVFCKKLLEIHKKNPIYGCKLSDKRGGEKNIHSWDIGYNGSLNEEEKDLLEHIMLHRRKKHWAEKKKITWMDGMPLTFEDISSFYKSDNLQSTLDRLMRLNYLRLEKPKDLINGQRKFKEDGDVGYNICKGKLSFPISKILDPEDVAPTLTATDANKLAVIVNDVTIRHLTPYEMKKICGFPEDFVIPDHVDYADLFGNMATPPVLESIFNLVMSSSTDSYSN